MLFTLCVDLNPINGERVRETAVSGLNRTTKRTMSNQNNYNCRVDALHLAARSRRNRNVVNCAFAVLLVQVDSRYTDSAVTNDICKQR